MNKNSIELFHLIQEQDSVLDRQYIDIIKLWAELENKKFSSRVYSLDTLPPVCPTQWFVTIAFSTNKKVNAVRTVWKTRLLFNEKLPVRFREYKEETYREQEYSKCKYGDLFPREQYDYLSYHLKKVMSLVSQDYYFFFEQTKDGNLHVHGIVCAPSSAMLLKHFHNYFDEPMANPYFMKNGLKPFNPEQWNNYNSKYSKVYQSVDQDLYPPVTTGKLCLSNITK